MITSATGFGGTLYIPPYGDSGTSGCQWVKVKTTPSYTLTSDCGTTSATAVWYDSTATTATSCFDDWYYENEWTNNSVTGTIRFRSASATWSDCHNDWIEFKYKRKTPEEQLKEIIRGRYAPAIITNRQPLILPKDVREQRARETLRRVIGDKKFLNFLKHGFISVKAKSGLIYQIFPGHGFTQVYDQGQMVDRLCVVLQGDFPPTDSLIMRYLLILNNEQHFRSCANKHSVPNQVKKSAFEEVKSLNELYKELKKVG